jgi:hypothetical protein
MSAAEVDCLVPNAQACRELGISEMTGWRWDTYPETAPPDWPEKIKRGNKQQSRTYRLRSKLERCKANLLRQALAGRVA